MADNRNLGEGNIGKLLSGAPRATIAMGRKD